MSDPTSSNRGLALPAHGSNTDQWDQPLNGNFNLLDTIVGGIASIATTGGITTLNAAQLACGTISVSGALISNAILYFPSVQGWWTIENLTTGAFVLQISPGGASATQVIAVPPGELTDIQINATVAKFRNLGRVGTYMDDCGLTVPAWITACTIPPYLNCDGTTFNAITYPFLNVRLGGNTLPDLRGGSRATLNQGTGRITTAGSGIDGDTRFSRGGSEFSQTHTHTGSGTTSTESATHTHAGGFSSQSNLGLAAGGNSVPTIVNTGQTGTESATHTHTYSFTSSSFGAGSSQNMPPATISGITMIRAA